MNLANVTSYVPVTAVASACGYITPLRFSAAYRGRFGRSPRDERRHDAHQQI
jgi:transcriptional regulator GlxA family with amidase domain